MPAHRQAGNEVFYKMKIILNPEHNLYEKGNRAYCDSLQIAETFEKRHDHVLRDIENALSIFTAINDPKFGEINFAKTSYKDARNRRQPKYLLAKDGFSYIVMGYEGEKAAQFKIAYINRFNQMEEFIKSLLSTKVEFPAFTEAVMLAHDEPKNYHFSNEINMIYRIVLGMDAKKFRQTHGLKDKESIKPYLTAEQIRAVEKLQRADIGLLELGHGNFHERKDELTRYYNTLVLRSNAVHQLPHAN
jgi:Rha family phage regulatory protein